MATKLKVSKISEAKDKAANNKAIVDKFAALHEQIAPMIKEYETLKKQVSAMAAAHTENTEVKVFGEKSIVVYSAPTKKTVLKPDVSAMEILEAAGGDFSVLSPVIGECKKILSARDMDRLFSEENGSRSFKAVIIV